MVTLGQYVGRRAINKASDESHERLNVQDEINLDPLQAGSSRP